MKFFVGETLLHHKSMDFDDNHTDQYHSEEKKKTLKSLKTLDKIQKGGKLIRYRRNLTRGDLKQRDFRRKSRLK